MADSDTGNDSLEVNADSNAGAKYTDDDMAKARKAWESKAEKKVNAASSAGRKSLLDELGHSSADDLREALEAHSDNATAAGEAVKLNKKQARELAAATAKIADLEALRADMVKSSNASKVQSALMAAAQAANADPARVLDSRKAFNAIAVDEDGTVYVRGEDGEPLHGKTVEEFVTEMVSGEPSLKLPSPGQGSGTAPNRGANGAAKPEAGSREEAFAAYQKMVGKQ